MGNAILTNISIYGGLVEPDVDGFLKFTVEDTRPDGSLPFLDTLVYQNIMEYSALGYTESQPIQTTVYDGIATITQD